MFCPSAICDDAAVSVVVASLARHEACRLSVCRAASVRCCFAYVKHESLIMLLLLHYVIPYMTAV